jgi:hypothetical protein
MSDKSTVEKKRRGEPTDAAIEVVIAAERQRCIDRVLTYAALRDQAAVDLDNAASGAGSEKPSEGAAERARLQAEVARDVARLFGRGDKSLSRLIWDRDESTVVALAAQCPPLYLLSGS